MKKIIINGDFKAKLNSAQTHYIIHWGTEKLGIFAERKFTFFATGNCVMPFTPGELFAVSELVRCCYRQLYIENKKKENDNSFEVVIGQPRQGKTFATKNLIEKRKFNNSKTYIFHETEQK